MNSERLTPVERSDLKTGLEGVVLEFGGLWRGPWVAVEPWEAPWLGPWHPAWQGLLLVPQEWWASLRRQGRAVKTVCSEMMVWGEDAFRKGSLPRVQLGLCSQAASQGGRAKKVAGKPPSPPLAAPRTSACWLGPVCLLLFWAERPWRPMVAGMVVEKDT